MSMVTKYFVGFSLTFGAKLLQRLLCWPFFSELHLCSYLSTQIFNDLMFSCQNISICSFNPVRLQVGTLCNLP